MTGAALRAEQLLAMAHAVGASGQDYERENGHTGDGQRAAIELTVWMQRQEWRDYYLEFGGSARAKE